jgi:hypothetical protein
LGFFYLWLIFIKTQNISINARQVSLSISISIIYRVMTKLKWFGKRGNY